MNDGAVAAADGLVPAIEHALVTGALPGETDGFEGAIRTAAARFVAAAAATRPDDRPALAIETIESSSTTRTMRIVAINDDRPFLVDSLAAAVAARGLGIHRLLHPIVDVERDAAGQLVSFGQPVAGARRESVVYMECDRADARERAALIEDMGRVLVDVRAATGDWAAMRSAMEADATSLPEGEERALVAWLAAGNFTLLGHACEAAGGERADELGIARGAEALWEPETRDAAFAFFSAGGEAPLLLKTTRVSLVHRRMPLDLVVVPVRDGGAVVRLSIHAGLWTSAALAADPATVPVLRGRLARMLERLRFDPASHAGKALRHVFTTLPHDLVASFAADTVERLALIAMSLTDRPRPRLVLATGRLCRGLFAFVWLPRDELTTARRVAIGARVAEQAGGRVVHWTVEAGEGDLASLRYTIERPADARFPDEDALNRIIELSVRGWQPAVEDSLVPLVGPRQAPMLAARYALAFPPAVRSENAAAEVAADIARLRTLGGDAPRPVRLHRRSDDAPGRVRLKLYRRGRVVPLSSVVPALENFGFTVIEEVPTALSSDLGTIHDFLIEAADPDALFARADAIENAITAVIEGSAENDAFNMLLVTAGLQSSDVVLFRAWFRYLRQAGLNSSVVTVVDALRRAPAFARALVQLFRARHGDGADEDAASQALDDVLAAVTSIEDDRILRRFRNLVDAVLRTNAFLPHPPEALAFKLDSSKVAGLPAPRPWREIWVYSPRLEGIHLRGGPVARGGLRWSDRRDDFRTEILGLMKAQVVKNAVIVPTGAKGGFYPKQLPSASDREAWLAEGTESYRIFIRTLLSITDNIVAGSVTHPEGVRVLDGPDPYFVVAADKGTATFSDVANAIALDRGFWLGDAFASGGGYGYDHKAMGITAKGGWVSVTRHFAEQGVDVQADPVTVVGCGDMSGDVFGNGMLLSKSLRLFAAFDHRHIFLDPDPNPAASWAERARLFALPRSSWADYDPSLISAGGGVFPRTQKAIPLSPEMRIRLGIAAETLDPSALIAAILKAPVDLLWFGGIGTYVKAVHQNNVDVGDPANDAHRVNGAELRAKVIGEGANLGVTQAGRIEFAQAGGRINTDFIDNSAGVDCSDNEVNIKIALNAEMAAGRLSFDDRNALLASMTDDVAGLVLEDNRLQTLALSLAERAGTAAMPAQLRVVEMLEAGGRLDRAVEGLASNAEFARRAADGGGLTRPELAVLLSHSKLALQEAVARSPLSSDPALSPVLCAAFPPAMQERFGDAIERHQLRPEIVATKVANRVVNRLGFVIPFELADEEGASLAQVATSYLAVETLFDIATLWTAIERAMMSEASRLRLIALTGEIVRLHMADLLAAWPGADRPQPVVDQLAPGLRRLDARVEDLLRAEARSQSSALAAELATLGVESALASRIVRLADLDGAIGTASLASRTGMDEMAATEAYVRLGEALGLDWAKAAALRARPTDSWERLLAAGLVRDFEQLRLDFLARHGADPQRSVTEWLGSQEQRVAQFRSLLERARAEPVASVAMLAQIGGQARTLLAR